MPASRQYISDAVKKRTDIASQSLREQWIHLVLAPLLKLDKSDYLLRAPLVLVVDALDESGGHKDIRTIVQLLAETQSLTSGRARLRVLLTSRSEKPIRQAFYQIPEAMHQDVVLEHISRSIVDHDIALLLQHDLQLTGHTLRLPADWSGAEIIAQLVQSAGGLFIWAAAACRFIHDGERFAPQRLETILRNDSEVTTGPEKLLNQIYTAVLVNLIWDRGDYTIEEHEGLLRTIRYVLGSIAALCSPLSTQSLGQLLDDTVGVKWALGYLHAILDIPDDGSRPICLHHPSLRNFLLDQNKCGDKFYVNEKVAHKELAGCCIELMSAPTSLRQNICSLSEPITLERMIGEDILAVKLPSEVRYACRYWIEHLERSQQNVIDGDTVHVFLQRHLIHWVEAMSLMGETAQCVRLLVILQGLIAVRGTEHDLYSFTDIECSHLQALLVVFCMTQGNSYRNSSRK